MGSSKARFKEARKRDGIHHQMDLLQRKIEDRQKYLWDNFQVCVSCMVRIVSREWEI